MTNSADRVGGRGGREKFALLSVHSDFDPGAKFSSIHFEHGACSTCGANQ